MTESDRTPRDSPKPCAPVRRGAGATGPGEGEAAVPRSWIRFRATRDRPLDRVTVAEVMSSPVRTVRLGDTLWELLTTFVTRELRHLVVVDERGGYAGTVTNRGLALAWPADPLVLRLRTVHDVVDASPCVTVDCSVSHAAAVMWRRRLEALPVVDGDRTVCGILTGTDLAGLIAARTAGAADYP
ncbi:CBS domain-containing protein [Streptacidiphilus griseoplanus]|uniref:CBS domain-containing protein n=1 Tax=Peterkaempfera griseoplana TaxID=66896 RepID=UPI0006E19380|nr:CBS domain-containing protein [Peterkaempfera griseoplana]